MAGILLRKNCKPLYTSFTPFFTALLAFGKEYNAPFLVWAPRKLLAIKRLHSKNGLGGISFWKLLTFFTVFGLTTVYRCAYRGERSYLHKWCFSQAGESTGANARKEVIAMKIKKWDSVYCPNDLKPIKFRCI